MLQITAERAKALMVELARVPSPLTALFEAEPQLRAFIDKAVEPRLREMGVTDIRRDAMGNLCATLGRNESGRSLMLVTNAMTQPPATMPNPYGGEVRDGAQYGLPGEVVLGKGLSEQKAPLAAILLALQSILAAKIPLSGQVVFLCCVSGETGRHDAIKQHHRGDRRARRNGDPQRHRQPHQPRQPRPRRRHRHGARQPGPFEPAAKRLQRRHRRAGGGPPAHRELESRHAASGARQGDACDQQDPQRAGFDPHHSGQLRDRHRPPPDARRGPRHGCRGHRGDCRGRRRHERPGQRQAVARRGDEGPVHVSGAGHRVVRGRHRA